MLPKIGAFRGRIRTLWRFGSQERAAIAQANGRLAREITPVEITQSKGSAVVVDCDEHPRQTSADQLASLKAPFREGGTVTAGNASGVNDGAAALLVCSTAFVERHNLTPLARIVGGKRWCPAARHGDWACPSHPKAFVARWLAIGSVGCDRAQRSLCSTGHRGFAVAWH